MVVPVREVERHLTSGQVTHGLGTAYVEAHRAELGAPWDDVGGGVTRESRDLRAEIGALMGAAHQVSQVGNRAQVAAAVTTLAEARKALYRLLADDDPTS